jgi:gliding motility-associated-like protein
MNPRKPVLYTLFLLLSYCSSLAQTPIPSATGVMDSLHRMQSIHYQGNQNNRSPFLPAANIPASFNRSSLQLQQQPARTTLQGARSARSMATICFDTSGRYFMQEDTMTYYVTNSQMLADGNVLISGQWASRNPPYGSGGFVMKCTDTGTLHWSRLYDSVNHRSYGYINYYRSLELQDGSFLLAGATNNPVTQNDDVIITHTDNAGNIIWSKTYRSKVWQVGTNGSGSYFYIQDIKQDPYSGDIFLSSPHWSDGYNITKFNIANGAVAWSKYYNTWGASFDRPIGFEITPLELVSFSSYTTGGTGISMYRINKNTGDTIATRFYQPLDASNSNGYVGFLNADGVTKLNNGNYALYGPQYKNYRWGTTDTMDMYHAGVVELDPAGNFVQAYSFRNPYASNSYNTKIQVFKDGSGVFSMLEIFSGYTANVYYVQFKDGQILKQRRKYYLGEGMPNENAALRLGDGSDLIIKLLGDSISNINKIEFLNLHISDTASNCLGWDDFGTYTEPYKVVPINYGIRSIVSNDLYESTNKTLITWNTTLYEIPACRQVSHCDTFSLVPSADTICVSGSLILTARKNPGCGASPFLEYDTSLVQSFQTLNDSTFLLNFKDAGEFKLYGSLPGCTMLTDSIKISVRRSNGQVSLGKDTVICPGNTIQLNARKGYKTYLWQDGSADSVLQVTQPGIYHVLVSDSCGNPFRDTLEVKPHPPIPFDIGMDAVTICEKDTLTITAPAAFFNYNWRPDYNTNGITRQSIRVAPARDTMYYVSAEKKPGCYVYDSILLKVNHSPAINLGADASFCSGDSLVLDAGAGFSQYQWSTGSTAQKLTVFNRGKYWVKADPGNGCKSVDTFQVLQVFNNPVPNLGTDGPLCEGTAGLLNPGTFSQYSWSTGSTDPTISVTQPGVYAVSVIDQHGCKGADTVTVDRLIAAPTGFLPADTTICRKSKYTLQPARTFSSYKWSTGSTGSSVIITQANTYWLEVKDQYQCTGRDTIAIALKDCMRGVYIPNAFTPNSNGRNDVFKPLVFGNLVKYEFHVYNRWGQPVFHSTDIRKGWDGIFQGSPQSGTFVWTCIWQLEDEEVKREKGVVVVVK